MEVKHSRRDSKNDSFSQHWHHNFMWPWYIRLDSKSGLSCKYIFPPRLQHFLPDCSSSLTKSFEENLLEELCFSFIPVLLWTFIHFAPYFPLTLSCNHLFIVFLLPPSFSHCFRLLPTAPVPSAFTAVSLTFPLSSSLLSNPLIWATPQGR